MIVETGVAQGLGGVLLCAALLRNSAEGHPGRYYGFDILPGTGRLVCGRYSEVGRVVIGDAIATIREMTSPVDLYINDSDHTAGYERREYEAMREKLAPGALIIGDNGNVTDELARFAQETGRRFIYTNESPKDTWYLGAGISFAFE